MTARALIFDRDGVLTRFDFAPLMRLFEGVPRASFESLWRAWQTHVRLAPPPRRVDSEALYIAAFWRTMRESWSLDARLEEQLNAFDYATAIRPFDDARPALEAARAAGMRIAVVSNFPFVGLDASLRAAGLADLVDVTYAAGIAGTPKPHASAYLVPLARLGVHPSECALVDDEEDCVQGARALGIRAYRLDRAQVHASHGVVPTLSAFVSLVEAAHGERPTRRPSASTTPS
jgi:putative hydrolase of the HAD superfamily